MCTNTNAARRLVQLWQQAQRVEGWGGVYHMPAGTKAESGGAGGGAGGGSVKEEITPGASLPPHGPLHPPSPPTPPTPPTPPPPSQPRLLHIKVKGLISTVA